MDGARLGRDRCDLAGPIVKIAACFVSIACKACGELHYPVQLRSLPSLHPQKLIYQTITRILYSMDRLVKTEMEKLWNPMVTGTDI